MLSGAALGHDLRSPGEPLPRRRRAGPSPSLPLRARTPRPLRRTGGSVHDGHVARGGRHCPRVACRRRRPPSHAGSTVVARGAPVPPGRGTCRRGPPGRRRSTPSRPARELARDAEAIADAIGDPEAGPAVRHVLGTTRASRPGKAGPPNIPTSSTPPPPGGPRQGPRTAPLRPLTCWPPGGPSTGTAGLPRPTCCSSQTRPSASAIPVCAARPRRWLPEIW